MKKFYSFLLVFFCIAKISESQCGTSVSQTHTNVSCNGLNNGAITVSASGGTPGYTYTWNGSASTSNTASNLSPGTYTCYVTDASPCTDSIVVAITQPSAMVLYPSANSSCTGGGSCTGMVSVNVGGGTAPYTYSWNTNPPINTQNGYGVCPGTYTIAVTDAMGCVATNTVYVGMYILAVDSIKSTPITSGPNCGCFTLTPYITGGGPLNYSWSSSYSWSATTAIPTICAAPVGTYTYTLNVTDMYGCYTWGYAAVTTPNNLFSVSAQVTNDSCNLCIGSVYNVNTSGGTAPFTYNWNGPSNFSSSQANVNGLCGGTYTLTVTDSAQCSVVQTYSPGNALNTYLSVSGTSPNCPNTCTGSASVSYTGPNPPYTYQWNTSPPQSTATASNLCPGTYTCTVTDNAGCMASVAKTVTALYSTPNLSPSNLINPSCGMCNGNFYIIGAFGYTINVTGPSGYNVTANNHPNLCAGVYTVTATRTGCTTYTNTVVLQLQSGALAGLTITPTITPESCTGMHDGSISLAISGTSSPLTFLWSNGQSTQNISNLVAGTYILTLTDTNNNCHKQTFIVPQNSSSCGYINGTVFADLNTDCSYNLGDYGISGVIVVALPGNYYAYTNALGNYSMVLPQGNYTVQHYNYQAGYGANCVLTQTVSLTPGSPTANAINFSDSIQPLPDLRIQYLMQSLPVPGFGETINFSVKNSSVFFTPSLDGTVKLVLQTDQYFNSAVPAPAQISGDTLIWSFTGLNTNQSLNYAVNVTVAANPSLIGTYFTNCASVTCTNQTDAVQWNNNYCGSTMVMGAFDPNDKAVTPAGENASGDIFLATDSIFTYTVRFQNTGNAAAYNVVVLDSIDSHLNPNTFELLGSSHTCAVDFLPGNTARFTFANIMLPDSFSNEPASHGWFQYRIKRNANTIEGDQVFNTAHIYFDFNPAIVTNTTTNTYVLPTSSSFKAKETELVIYPNPAQNMIFIRETGNKKIERVELYDLSGKLCVSQNANQSFVSVSLNELSKGVYLVKIKTEGGAVTMKKVSVMK
jgi:uncharacterized repeat protein (TIGR01451 family)